MDEELDYKICPKCKGTGRCDYSVKKGKISFTEENFCNKCEATGKIDWLQELMPGKPHIYEELLEEVFDETYWYESYDYEDYYDGYEDLPYWWDYDHDGCEKELLKNRDKKNRRNKDKCLKKRPT